jgi:hypothetical protein
VTLQINLMNPFIKKIMLFQTVRNDFRSLLFFEKIETVMTENRLTIGEMYEHGIASHPTSILILSNSDIYYDNTLIHLQHMRSRELFTISRQQTVVGDRKNLTVEAPKTNFFNNFCTFYHASHDVFAVRGPIDKSIIAELSKAYLGEWGTDNYINEIFKETNWKLSNPCNKILVHHLHSMRSEGKDKKKRNLGEEYGKFAIQFPPVTKYELEMLYEVPAHYWLYYFDTLGRNNKKMEMDRVN